MNLCLLSSAVCVALFYDDDDDGYATHRQQFNGIIQWATYCTRYTRMSYVTHTHTSAVNRPIRTKTNQTHWKVCRTKIYCVNWNCIHICTCAIHILYVVQKATIHHNGHIVRTETHWCVMAKTPNEVDCWTICLSFPLLLSFVGCYRLLLCIFICAWIITMPKKRQMRPRSFGFITYFHVVCVLLWAFYVLSVSLHCVNVCRFSFATIYPPNSYSTVVFVLLFLSRRASTLTLFTNESIVDTVDT